MPAVNDDKTATFDKATKTITTTRNSKLQYGGSQSVYCELDRLDVSDYNVARVKYKSKDFGFLFNFEYDGSYLKWYEKATYCPSYLNEMVIPLDKKYKKLKGIYFSVYSMPHAEFVIESVTLEKVENPVKTDIYLSDEPPVIDKAASGTIDANLDAWDFVKNIGAGLNYQIFQDAPSFLDFGVDIQPDMLSRPTKAQIHFMKESGLNGIRLQTNPGHGKILDKNYRIAPGYIRNIKQVIDWCMEEDMYVILCGPFAEFTIKEEYKKRIERGDSNYAAYYVNEKDKKESERFLKAVWEQYAKAFNNSYDERLIFEPFNEPADMLHEHGWAPKDDCAVCKKDYEILNEYNQLVVDTIRSTGGNNANRFILINGLGSKCESVTSKNLKMPKDKAKNKLIATYHDYSMGGSAAAGDYTDYFKKSVKDLIDKRFAALDKAFFSKHIPVIVGEIGQSRRSPILERINWIKYFTAEASKPNRSCAAVLHNDSVLVDDGRFFSGYYDSWKLKWYDKEFVDTFIYGMQGKEYPLSADFIKKNEVKIESIVGKNLINEPFDTKKWGANYKINSDTFVRSVPESYKLEFVIKKTGSSPTIQITWEDENYQWHKIPGTAKKIKGGSLADGNVRPSKTTFTVEIDSETAKTIEDSNGLYLMGQDVIIQSMTVVE